MNHEPSTILQSSFTWLMMSMSGSFSSPTGTPSGRCSMFDKSSSDDGSSGLGSITLTAAGCTVSGCPGGSSSATFRAARARVARAGAAFVFFAAEMYHKYEV